MKEKIQPFQFIEAMKIYKELTMQKNDLIKDLTSMEFDFQDIYRNFIQPKSDTNWLSTSRHDQSSRGIHNYKRTIVTPHLNEMQEKILRSFLENVNCPGWTGVTLYKNKEDLFSDTWEATTCWDSSD